MFKIFKPVFLSFPKKSPTTTRLRTTRAKMSKFITQQEAIDIDEKLFNQYKFSVDQLMELAGLSVASAIMDAYPNKSNAIILCGPGNNGGDGLVCARHMKLFGYNTTIYYPKRTDKELYHNLVTQCSNSGVQIRESEPSFLELNDYDLIIDALFGFSFKPPVRDTFVEIMKNLKLTETPICSIDIPSGWHVEHGPTKQDFHPQCLISLTAPKKCARYFKGKLHYLGGRFVPPALLKEYDLELPKFPGSQNFVLLINY